MTETMLTPQDVADKLKVKVGTVWTWIRAKKLKAYSVGTSKYYRIKQSDFEAFMEIHKKPITMKGR